MKVAVTEFLNTYPLIWYFEQNYYQRGNDSIELIRATPAECALMLMSKEVDYGVVPIAAYAFNQDFALLLNPCVASRDHVATVKLYSPVDIRDIREVMIDKDSKTSVILLQILLKYKYKNPNVKFVKYNFSPEHRIINNTGYMLIGDKNFLMNEKFAMEYDLAYEWVEWVNLPFIFAVWMLRDKNNGLRTSSLIKKAYRASKSNFEQMCADASIKWNMPLESVKKYFTENIAFEVGLEGLKSIRLFFEMAASLELLPRVERYTFLDVQ